PGSLGPGVRGSFSPPPSRMARRRSRPPPFLREEPLPTLDLHGETAESARRLAERWLREQQAHGVRAVRVVTGRGRRSLGPPVLRGEIEDLLASLKGSVVDSAESDAAGGAFRVELRRPRRPRPPRPPPPSPYLPPAQEADLRRRALESLSDLGIDPTPELVEAEM